MKLPTIQQNNETPVNTMAARTFIVLGISLCVAAIVWYSGTSDAPVKEAVEVPSADVGASDAPIGSPFFEDVTSAAEVAFTYRNGEEAELLTILESLGGGVALLDYDSDGLLDFYVTGGGRFAGADDSKISGLPGKVFRNLGDFQFRDVTEETGLTNAPFYTHGAVAGDYDNDGRPDMLITGYGGLALYRNVDGTSFHDVTQTLKLAESKWVTSAAFADLTGSGRSDLFAARYVNWSFSNDPVCASRGGDVARDVCPPQAFQALPSSLYRNDGAAFTDLWPELQIANTGMALGVVVADLNEDGRPDIYVANDGSKNWLLLNRGEGKFEEVGLASGVSVDDSGRYNGSMGIDVGDYDGSGKASLWVTNFESELPALYQNIGREQFIYQSQAAGIGAIGGANVGFGTSFLDIDNDGWLDLVMVNGHVVRHPVGAPVLQKPVLLRNEQRLENRVFRDVSGQGGSSFQVPAMGRGLAVGDLDNDGWPDVVIVHSNTPLKILRNSATMSNEHHWLGVQLLGRNHRPIAGATVTLEVDGRRLTRFARSGGSYLSSSDPRILFGLGRSNMTGILKVRWPWGQTQTWEGLAVDQYWELVEGEVAPQPVHAIR